MLFTTLDQVVALDIKSDAVTFSVAPSRFDLHLIAGWDHVESADHF